MGFTKISLAKGRLDTNTFNPNWLASIKGKPKDSFNEGNNNAFDLP